MPAWLERWTRALRRDPAIDDTRWTELIAASPLFAALPETRLVRLRDCTRRFLARKRFSAAGGHALDDDQCLAIAALASLPVLEADDDALDGWREVIVYPGEFRARRSHEDEATGVVCEGDEDLIGEAWDRGPVVLSWADVATDLAHPFDGFNVVVHEIAHKLDQGDGAMNGVPRLPAHIPRREWIDTMQRAYDGFLARVDAGDHTAMDPYAAESAEEFFAVTSELHFSDPHALAEDCPQVAALLARFYGPLALPPRVAGDLARR